MRSFTLQSVRRVLGEWRKGKASDDEVLDALQVLIRKYKDDSPTGVLWTGESFEGIPWQSNDPRFLSAKASERLDATMDAAWKYEDLAS